MGIPHHRAKRHLRPPAYPTPASGLPENLRTAPGEIANFRPYIDSVYVNDMKPVVRDQLVKGGLRLARMLNETLK